MTAASRQQVEPASGERWDRQPQQPHSPAFTTRSLDLRTGGPPVGWEQGLQVESRLLFRPHLPPFPSLSLISAPPRMGPEQSMRVMGETVLGDAPLWGPPPPRSPRTGCAGELRHPTLRLTPAHLDGVMGVRSFPMVWITRLPHTQRPVQIPTPP